MNYQNILFNSQVSVYLIKCEGQEKLNRAIKQVPSVQGTKNFSSRAYYWTSNMHRIKTTQSTSSVTMRQQSKSNWAQVYQST